MNGKDSDKILDIKHLSIRDTKGRFLIKDVSFDVQKNENMGIVGESGSGKTLTAKAILDILPPGLKFEAEKMFLTGKNLPDLKPKERRRLLSGTVGFVPQNTLMYQHPYIKICNQVADGYIFHTGSSKEDALENIKRLLVRVGIDEPERVLKSYPAQLSGGMYQRVNIAMALLSSPKLIIADEPTTALDCIVQKQVMLLFKELSTEFSVSIVMVSHDLNLIRKYCDRIVVMYAGQTVEEASAAEAFAGPRHPYTRALTALVPRIGRDRRQRLSELPGAVMEYDRGRQGCIFAERCSLCEPECSVSAAEVREGRRFVRCNLEKERR